MAKITKKLELIYSELEHDVSSKPSNLNMVKEIELAMEKLLIKKLYLEETDPEKVKMIETQQS